MSISAKVSMINNDRITVSLNDGQSLALPVSAVEGTVKVGSEVLLIATAPENENAGREKMACDLLNELLKT